VRPGIGEVEFQTDAEEPPHWFLFVHLPPKLGMAKAGMTNTIAVQSNWDNRQFSSSRSLNVHRLFEFLLQSGKPTKLFDIYVFLLLKSGTFLVSLSFISLYKALLKLVCLFSSFSDPQDSLRISRLTSE
jgi:hypothetical protein